MLPYVASVIAYFVMLATDQGNLAKVFPEYLIVAMFFPYIASAAWLISIYAIGWIALDWFRMHRMG